MRKAFRIDPNIDYYKWIEMDGKQEPQDIRNRCTKEYINQYLSHFNDISVENVILNDTGAYTQEGLGTESELPAYCEVRLQERIGNGQFNTITVYLPLVWNNRFLAMTGGSTRTMLHYKYYAYGPMITWPVGVRNHFACACCDAGNPSMGMTWGFKAGTNSLDWELLESWSYKSHHRMTQIAKELCVAFYGESPAYSYMSGTSGGGRSCLGAMKRFPTDYNGFLAYCPGMPWIDLHLSLAWAFMVMKDTHLLGKEKLEAFRSGLFKKYNAQDGYIKELFPEFDPFTMVGVETSEGVITVEDAEIIQRIWAGPTRANGEKMADGYGPIPAVTVLPEPMMASPQIDQVLGWVSGDPNFSIENCTMREFERLYDIGKEKFSCLDFMFDPDVRAFKDAGGKLILSHSSADNSVPMITTVKYYKSLIEQFGSEETVKQFARLYLTPGGGHALKISTGETLVLSDSFAALMKWCEDGIAPERLRTPTYDFKHNSVEYKGITEPASLM